MQLLKRLFKTNSQADSSRVMIQCRSLVNKDAVTRTSIDGVEHIIITSATLPDDVVMNGGLYPAEEIEKSFESLEMTLAPVEHPTDSDGNFISASDPRAIHNFHAGAFNTNVRRENGRVFVDKTINVQEALKTERGKRLLDRIDELENNSDPRPIHTSVGVFLMPEELSEPKTNADGMEYSWIARDMVFDHDAILLDSVGAAQPHQGVGVAVNSKGEEIKVSQVDIDEGHRDHKVNSIITESQKSLIELAFNELSSNAEGRSFNEIEGAIRDELQKRLSFSDNDYLWLVDVFPQDSTVIYDLNDDLFTVPFAMSEEGHVTIVGIPQAVERNVTFTPKINHSEGDAMKELMLNALKEAGVEVNADVSDADLLAKYNELQANQSDSGDLGASDDKGTAEVIANALKPLTDKIDSLEAKFNEADTAEVDRLAGIVANSGKYVGLDVDSAKMLPVEKLKEMAANCQSAFGISPVFNQGGASDGFAAPSDMPE